ncbi:uncharacterized protein PAE49_015398 isoform 2-T2 [Odontesthes bonariensis]|uniref:uncharacterized protein LOC142398391 isoform X1 n=2 Tax=Odontesthes bonariensis TaxID=219752 RepID=UPI003F583345
MSHSYDADDLDLFSSLLSVKVEYYRSFEYRLKWKGSMSPQRMTRLSKASKKNVQKNPVPNEDDIRRRLRGQRVRAWLEETGADDCIVDTDKGKDCDMIDIINGACAEERVAEQDGGETVEVVDNGLDVSHEDSGSECSSIASGPSFLHHGTSKKLKPSRVLCSACRKLHQKAKRTKAPVRTNVTDNDPQSLTCDQWVLIKKWTPRRLPNATRKLLSHTQLEKDRGQRPGQSSVCSRPHTFLQRNLRRCAREPAKKQRKKNTRKRTRDGCQGSRVAKQQRLQSNSHRQHIDISPMDDSPNSCFSSWRRNRQDIHNRADADLTAEVIPSSVTRETTKAKDIRAKRVVPKKACGFADLLAQLRGNSSVIVRETR